MMRREGFELMVGRPEIVTKEVNGKLMEPLEHLTIDIRKISSAPSSSALDPAAARWSKCTTTATAASASSFAFLSRLIGLRSDLLTENARHHGDELPLRRLHASSGTNPAAPHWSPHRRSRRQHHRVRSRRLEDRGVLFIPPGVEVYEGMVIGEHSATMTSTSTLCARKS